MTVELAVVVGKKGRDIAPENADEYIGGYGRSLHSRSAFD